MTYTVILQDKTVFYTDEYKWADYFLIINNISHQYSTNGNDWIDIEDDHL